MRMSFSGWLLSLKSSIIVNSRVRRRDGAGQFCKIGYAFCLANNALSFAPSPRSMFMRACRARCP